MHRSLYRATLCLLTLPLWLACSGDSQSAQETQTQAETAGGMASPHREAARRLEEVYAVSQEVADELFAQYAMTATFQSGNAWPHYQEAEEAWEASREFTDDPYGIEPPVMEQMQKATGFAYYKVPEDADRTEPLLFYTTFNKYTNALETAGTETTPVLTPGDEAFVIPLSHHFAAALDTDPLAVMRSTFLAEMLQVTIKRMLEREDLDSEKQAQLRGFLDRLNTVTAAYQKAMDDVVQ